MKASDLIGQFRFRRSSPGSGGGGVSDVVEGEGFLVNRKTTYNPSITPHSKILLEKNIFIDYTTANPGGGSNSLRVTKILEDGATQIIDSISFYFGATYMGSPNFEDCAAISANKDFIIIVGSGVKKIYAVPISKNGENYSLGTPIEYSDFDDDDEISNPVGIKDNEFAIAIYNNTEGTKEIRFFDFENNSISLTKTLQTNTKPIFLKFADNKFLVYSLSNSAEIVKMDGTLKNLSVTTAGIIKSFVMENFVVLLTSNFSGLIVVDLSKEEIVTMDKSKLEESAIYSTYINITQNSLKMDDSKYVILWYGSTKNKPMGFIFDFKNNTVTNTVIVDNFESIVLGSGTYSSFYSLLIEDKFLVYVNSSNAADFSLFSAAISLKYQGNTYELKELGE